MNVVEKVKLLCKARKIPVYKLEKDLGFANSYIGQLRKGSMPLDRLEKIAEYFELPLSFFTEKEDIPEHYLDPEAAEIAKELYERPDLKILFKATRNVDPEDLKVVQNMVDALIKKDY